MFGGIYRGKGMKDSSLLIKRGGCMQYYNLFDAKFQEAKNWTRKNPRGWFNQLRQLISAGSLALHRGHYSILFILK